jgi:hypothetical protein
MKLPYRIEMPTTILQYVDRATSILICSIAERLLTAETDEGMRDARNFAILLSYYWGYVFGRLDLPDHLSIDNHETFSLSFSYEDSEDITLNIIAKQLKGRIRISISRA